MGHVEPMTQHMLSLARAFPQVLFGSTGYVKVASFEKSLFLLCLKRRRSNHESILFR